MKMHNCWIVEIENKECPYLIVETIYKHSHIGMIDDGIDIPKECIDNEWKICLHPSRCQRLVNIRGNRLDVCHRIYLRRFKCNYEECPIKMENNNE